jgi:drug/metabolite transporter (DMT)-like permease
MVTKFWAIFLVAFCTVLTTSAQLIYKKGLDQPDMLITALWLGVGLIIYGVGALLLVIALKGGELSVLYPVIATSFIWVTLSAFFLFGEALSVWKWLGIFSIMLGVSLIGFGGSK